MVAAVCMRVVGKIESLWRYPVKSMRGEELTEFEVVNGVVKTHGPILDHTRTASGLRFC
jgi:uncharacterized protein YcbX